MKKGFTLIELLIVIGILAILATATILVLNPAQLFAQARDSQRISDMAALKSALSFYLATAGTLDLDVAGTCGTNFWASAASSAEDFAGTPIQHANTGLAVDGTGWVAANLTLASGGSPLSALPRDPSNVSPNTYRYQCDNTNRWFELNADMESTRYASGGTNDVEGTDGGSVATIYEVGNDPGLDL
ncbi:MAG: prepilin-type N-terminal cleavage/methylation domain-containing protein [Candidatus Harrisonbacteria bacterium]|nr:prepilin-type N-terminal cleavage/methylation domain-containing protein [Candidatus Harrisonbacteria bacterium]MBI3114504.1 prepilin-type N-terminal cleavage/methylation domain-containing protein [Candidatus Harrisonbacteria bacterium]